MVERVYERVLNERLDADRQMAFVSGPRQVGKTTSGRAVLSAWGPGSYLSWDLPDDRRTILRGPEAVAADVEQLTERPPLVVLDELHRYRRWRDLLKAVYDAYADRLRVLVTGSARLEVFSYGGDSLMGRYFPYRMHPLSLAEMTDPTPPSPDLVRPPVRPEPKALDRLLRFGGFPEPLLRGEESFHRRWSRLRVRQLVREDLRDLTAVQDIDRIAVLAELICAAVGSPAPHAGLARDLGVSADTVSRWLRTLSGLYYCFEVRPWYRNVARALRKRPKYYLWDWTQVAGDGPRAENLVACALRKAADLWTDLGLASVDVRYVRDKQGKEVDFLVVRDDRPWFLVEVKRRSKSAPSAALHHFQAAIGATHAFQVGLDAPFVDVDPFTRTDPVVVPAATLLTQLA